MEIMVTQCKGCDSIGIAARRAKDVKCSKCGCMCVEVQSPTTEDHEWYVVGQEIKAPNDPLTIRDIEQIARRDPDHDWRVVLFAPLSGETFQRQGDHLWVSIDQNRGFA